MTNYLFYDGEIIEEFLPDKLPQRADHIRPGMRINHIVVLKTGGVRKYKCGSKVKTCRCICDCGVIITADCGRFLAGNKTPIKSCGCKKKGRPLRGNRKYTDPRDCTLNMLYRRYKNTAARRGIKWRLSEALFRQYLFKNCFYCGIEPMQEANVFVANTGRLTKGNGEWVSKAWVKYNGIDRVDSNEGYVFGNLRTCCSTCNYAKNKMTTEQFFAWIDRIVDYWKT